MVVTGVVNEAFWGGLLPVDVVQVYFWMRLFEVASYLWMLNTGI